MSLRELRWWWLVVVVMTLRAFFNCYSLCHIPRLQIPLPPITLVFVINTAATPMLPLLATTRISLPHEIRLRCQYAPGPCFNQLPPLSLSLPPSHPIPRVFVSSCSSQLSLDVLFIIFPILLLAIKLPLPMPLHFLI
jgi:hypothetical protein